MTPTTDGFYYLASPYSGGVDADGREARAQIANQFAGGLLARGVFTFQPIWSTHEIAKRHDLPKEHEFWIAYNKAFIDPALGVIVCNMPGWQESRGVTQEISYARSIGKPVLLCCAGTFDLFTLGSNDNARPSVRNSQSA